MDGDKQVEAKFSAPAGEQLWLRQFGGSGSDLVDWVGADGAGDVIIAGTFEGTVDFGGGMTETSAGGPDVYVAKLSGTDGSTMWVQTFGGTATEWLELDGAVDANGDVVVTGRFSSATASVDAMTINNQGSGDIFVFKLSGTDGSPVWVKGFGSTGFDRGLAVATNTSGDVFVTGGFASAALTIGTDTLTNQGASDVFVAKLAAGTGDPIWANSYGAGSEDIGRGIAVDGFGNAVITGAFRGTVNFGGLLSLTADGNNDDIFVAKYDGGGDHLWSSRYGGTAADVGEAVAVDGDGVVNITGRIDSTGVTFGGDTFNPANTALYIARFTVGGNHIWSKAWATTSYGSGSALSIPPLGSVWIAGKFTGTLNLGGGSMNSAGGSSDVVLASFATQDGAHEFSRQYGGAAQDFGNGVAALSDRIIICGGFQGVADFPGESLTSSGADDGFCLAVAP